MPSVDKRSEIICKATLILVFLIGVALLLGGLWGNRQFEAAGFNQENAFSLIYQMSGETDRLYQKKIAPALKASGADTAAVGEASRNLIASAWKTEEPLNATLEGLSGAQLTERELKLLAMTYTLGGPKIKTAQRKKLAALSSGEQTALLNQLLLSVAGNEQALPEVAEELCKGLEGEDRTAMLMQIFMTTANLDGEPLSSTTIAEIKKAVRTDDMRVTAYTWAVEDQVSWLSQLFCSAGKTFALTGILLMLDVLILFFWLLAEHNWQLDFKWMLILLIVDFMLMFQVLPTLNMVIKAIFPDGKFSMNTIARLYTYDLNLSALMNTLIAAFCTMIVGTIIAFPLAWLVGRTNLYGKRFFRSLFVLTYMVPPYVGAMAWLRLLNPNVGNINLVLRTLFGLSDAPGPLNIYSLPGLIWVLSTFYYPYAFITISRAMEKMDPSLEEASRISGASPVKTVAKITFPMMTPSLIAGALLVFVAAASCYGIPSIIGAPGRVHTVTTRIIDYVGRGSEGMNDATGLGVFLMVLAIIILYVSDFVVAKRQYITVSGKSTQPNIVDLGKWRTPITVMVSLFACIVILIPFATILITSFKVDLGKSLWDTGNFTFKHWITIFSWDEMLDCLKNSFIFAIITASIGIIVACTMSYLLQRTRIRGRKLPDFLITLGSGTPSVVIALSLILSMRGDFGINIYKTAYIMIIAYLIKYRMMGMRTVVSAMSQIHVSLEESSQISGATWLKTMFKITGPLIFPSIAAGWFLIFIPSFYELSMTTLLYGNGTKTIGFELYEYWTFTSQPMACAIAFAILMVVVILNYVLNKLTKGEFSI